MPARALAVRRASEPHGCAVALERKLAAGGGQWRAFLDAHATLRLALDTDAMDAPERDGFLQAYREHLGIALEAHALRVHARMPTGASVLLTEQMALTDALRDAASFHVFGVIGVSRPPPATTTHHTSHPDPVLGVETPSLLQLKAQLARKAPRRPR